MTDAIYNSGYTLVHGEGEWSALYDANGDLISYGDEYVQNEFIQKLFGVGDLYVKSFTFRKQATSGVRAGHSVEKAYGTLAEVEAAQAAYESERDRIAQLREQAAELTRQADAEERALRESRA